MSWRGHDYYQMNDENSTELSFFGPNLCEKDQARYPSTLKIACCEIKDKKDYGDRIVHISAIVLWLYWAC